MSITSYSVIAKQTRWLALTLSLIVVLFAAGSLFASRHRRDVAQVNNGETTTPPLERRHTLIESESLTVTRRGFAPALITRAQGEFILMVDNRSGLDLNFRFSRETGEPLHEIRTSQQELDWNEVLDLQPGTYVLTERDHPEWKCLIRITAR